MTRLTSILLAGTVVPVLLLAPAAFAQAPDQGGDRHPQHQRGEGVQGGQGGMKGEGHQRAQGEHGGQGARNGQGEHGQGERMGQGEGMGHGERRQGHGQGHDADGGPGAGGRGDGDQRGERRGHKDADAAAPTPAPSQAQAPAQGADTSNRGDRAQNRQERQERRKDRGMDGDHDNAQGGPRGGDRQRMGADRDGMRRDGDKGPDDGMRTGDRDRGPNGRGPGDRGPSDRALGERGPGERSPGERMGNDDNGRRPGGPGDDRGPGRAGPGFAGGFIAPTGAHRLDDIRRDRREVREGDRVFIREPGRTIVQENGRAFIVHDETDRFRELGLDVRRERRGDQFIDTVRRPNGEVILTYTDGTGRLLRRVRRGPDGREFVLIDNGVGGRIGSYEEDVIVLPPPPLRIPRERYIVDYRDAAPGLIYDTLIAPPLAAPPRRYTLDQIRYSPDIRNYVRSVDINTINFDSGSWEVPPEAGGKLQALASAINKAIDRNANSVFLVEGFTDATGNADDNLSLSDRRAQSVAEILSKDFNVPPENLTTQGYGEQNPKEQTDGPSAVNRRVVVQNITPLLASGGSPAGGQ